MLVKWLCVTIILFIVDSYKCSLSDNDVLYAEWSVDSQTAHDSCGEGCAQLDDFNWFLPADDRVGDLPFPRSLRWMCQTVGVKSSILSQTRLLCR